jgi:sulfate adenylyltransferase subunit 1
MSKVNNNNIQLLRFTTAGSVDDGKSTLIGRLLYDSKLIPDDQYESIKTACEKKGEKAFNLAMLTDGLRAEREQGITIDVAYRYFATSKRKFIIADTPGHFQYTRNMVTGASNADLALILVDARNGIVEQTRRHTYIASLLGISHLFLCINKMDLVDYSEQVFNDIKKEFAAFSSKLTISNIQYIPISALLGNNLVSKSNEMYWYNGAPLLTQLETLEICNTSAVKPFRFPVQYVIRANSTENPDYIAYAGRVVAGTVRPNDMVMLLPSKQQVKLKSVEFAGNSLDKACYPMSVSITLNDNNDLSRGDMIVGINQTPTVSTNLKLMVCWFNQSNLELNNQYLIKHTTRETIGVVQKVEYKIDINTLQQNRDDDCVGMNDFALISIKTAHALFFDKYEFCRQTGSLIIIDKISNETLGVGMIL